MCHHDVSYLIAMYSMTLKRTVERCQTCADKAPTQSPLAPTVDVKKFRPKIFRYETA